METTDRRTVANPATISLAIRSSLRLHIASPSHHSLGDARGLTSAHHAARWSCHGSAVICYHQAVRSPEGPLDTHRLLIAADVPDYEVYNRHVLAERTSGDLSVDAFLYGLAVSAADPPTSRGDQRQGD